LAGVSIPQLEAIRFALGSEHTLRGMRVRAFSATQGMSEINVSRVENVAPDEAERAMKQRRFQVESLYQEEKSAYPGFISKTVGCGESFVPVVTGENTPASAVLRIQAAANGRKSLGVCSEAEFKYKTVGVMLYCKRSRLLLQIETFLNKSEDARKWLSEVSCKS
jgi:hypothetical protein